MDMGKAVREDLLFSYSTPGQPRVICVESGVRSAWWTVISGCVQWEKSTGKVAASGEFKSQRSCQKEVSSPLPTVTVVIER